MDGESRAGRAKAIEVDYCRFGEFPGKERRFFNKRTLIYTNSTAMHAEFANDKHRCTDNHRCSFYKHQRRHWEPNCKDMTPYPYELCLLIYKCIETDLGAHAEPETHAVSPSREEEVVPCVKTHSFEARLAALKQKYEQRT